MMSCSNCVYFRPGARAATKDGICRRHPPNSWSEEGPEAEAEAESTDDDDSITLTLRSVVTYIGWPDVMSHDWCGEWAAPLDNDMAGDPGCSDGGLPGEPAPPLPRRPLPGG